MNLTDLLVDVAIETNAAIRAIASKLSLTASQAYHLLLIPFDGIPMSELAKKLGLDSSTLTRNISNLEKHNYISRKASNRDRRIQLIFLTKRGINAVADIENHLEEYNFDDDSISEAEGLCEAAGCKILHLIKQEFLNATKLKSLVLGAGRVLGILQ